MKIKSLILGSATVALATTGVQAADAIVIAEPEPVEYVRVCDVYGAGFFYIPGTETCLRIGGEARFQVGSTNAADPFLATPAQAALALRHADAGNFALAAALVGTDTLYGTNGITEADTYTTEARGRFYLDARSETEFGTLRGYIRVDASRGSAAIRTNKAYVELGGFKAGYEDSAWAYTPNAGAANYGSHSDTGLAYGYQQRNLIQYNFSGGNGFFATLSLEDDGINELAALTPANPPVPPLAVPGFNNPLTGIPAYSDRDYVPDVVVKAGINQGWGAAWAAVGYDSNRTNVASQAISWIVGVPGQLGDSGWAAQLGTQINVPGAPGSSFRLIGYYADSDNAYNGHGGEWSVLASYYHQFTSTFGASLGVQYVSDLYAPGTDVNGFGHDRWNIEANAVWTPVKDFAVRTEIVYSDITSGALGNPDSSWSGYVRFSRFF